MAKLSIFYVFAYLRHRILSQDGILRDGAKPDPPGGSAQAGHSLQDPRHLPVLRLHDQGDPFLLHPPNDTDPSVTNWHPNINSYFGLFICCFVMIDVPILLFCLIINFLLI